MDLSEFTKSIIDMDRASIVICDLNHIIIYMNPAAAKNYKKHGGNNLVGRSLKKCHNASSNEKIDKVISWFKERINNNMIYTYYNEKENKDVYMVALRDKNKKLIGYYEKHEYRNRETAKLYDFNNSLI